MFLYKTITKINRSKCTDCTSLSAQSVDVSDLRKRDSLYSLLFALTPKAVMLTDKNGSDSDATYNNQRREPVL